MRAANDATAVARMPLLCGLAPSSVMDAAAVAPQRERRPLLSARGDSASSRSTTGCLRRPQRRGAALCHKQLWGRCRGRSGSLQTLLSRPDSARCK